MPELPDPWSNFFTTDFSKPTEFQKKLAQTAAQGYGSTSRRASRPVAPTPTQMAPPVTQGDPFATSATSTTQDPRSSAAAYAAAQPKPAPRALTHFDRLRDGIQRQYEAELGAFKERESQGFRMHPLAYKRAGERYRNAMAGLDAEERRAGRVAEQPAKIAAAKQKFADQAATTKANRMARGSARADRTYTNVEDARIRGANERGATARSDAFNDSYTSVEDIRNRGSAERTAAASASGQSTQPVSDVKGLVSSTPQGSLHQLAAPKTTQEILAALDPRVKAHLARSYKDPTSRFGQALRNGGLDSANEMVRGLADLNPDQQLEALTGLESQLTAPSGPGNLSYQDERSVDLARTNRSAAEQEAALSPEYKQERDQLLREYKAQEVDFTFGAGGQQDFPWQKFEQDLQRRLALKHPSQFGSTATAAPKGPESLAEHIDAGVQRLNDEIPALQQGTQFKTGVLTTGAVGPLAPVGTGLAAGTALAQTAATGTMEDDAVLQALATLATKGYADRGVRAGLRNAQIDQHLARQRAAMARDYKVPGDPPTAQLPPPSPPPGPNPPPPSGAGRNLPGQPHRPPKVQPEAPVQKGPIVPPAPTKDVAKATKEMRSPPPLSNEEVLAKQQVEAEAAIARAKKLKGLLRKGPRGRSTPTDKPIPVEPEKLSNPKKAPQPTTSSKPPIPVKPEFSPTSKGYSAPSPTQGSPLKGAGTNQAAVDEEKFRAFVAQLLNPFKRRT